MHAATIHDSDIISSHNLQKETHYVVKSANLVYAIITLNTREPGVLSYSFSKRKISV